MCPAPPTGGICRISAVRRPRIALVFVETVEITDILGKTNRLERAHILSARENICPLERYIDVHHRARDIFLFVELQTRENTRKRSDKIAPDKRNVGYRGCFSYRNVLRLDDLEPLAQQLLTLLAHMLGIEEYMQRIEFLIFGINAVACEASAESVRAVVHGYHTLDNLLSGHTPALA